MAQLINIKAYNAKHVIRFYELEDELAEFIHNTHTTCGEIACEDAGGGVWNEVESVLETLTNEHNHYENYLYDFLHENKYSFSNGVWKKRGTKWEKKNKYQPNLKLM